MTQVTHEMFGEIPGEGRVEKWILMSPNVTVEIINLGCIITSIKCKGKNGQVDDIVLGYDHLEGSLNISTFMYIHLLTIDNIG